MRLLSSNSDRVYSIAATAIFVFSAAVITGCASKNPLIDDEPVAVGKAPTPAPAPKQQQAQASTPAQSVETKSDTALAAAGVQTTKQRRFLGVFSPYRITIQQGNFVSREMVAQLKEGMTPDQVRFVLGTPLLMDIFHADRWDYPFRLIEGNGEVTSSRVTVFFKENRLARIEGGDLPTEKDFLALIADAPPEPKKVAPVPQTPPSEVDESINRQQQ